MDLLRRCVRGFTQNNNESFNKTIWQFARKETFCSLHIIKITAFLATCLFNKGAITLLQIINVMGHTTGHQTYDYASTRNGSQKRTSAATKNF